VTYLFTFNKTNPIPLAQVTYIDIYTADYVNFILYLVSLITFMYAHIYKYMNYIYIKNRSIFKEICIGININTLDLQ